MFRLLALGLVVLLFSGCTLFTKPTGTITIPRQDFVNTWAVVKVLYQRVRAEGERYCLSRETPASRAACFDQLHRLDIEARLIAVQVDAKIETVESEIDWAVIAQMARIITSLIP